MRVGYDEQILIRQVRGGISRYVISLIEAFRRQQHLDIKPVLGWRWSDNAHAIEAGLTRAMPPRNGHDNRASLRRRAYYLGNGDRRLRARRADGLHHTYYDARFLSSKYRGIRITTIYDMIPELFPETFPGGNPHLDKRRFVENSDLLLFISESARGDMIDCYGDPGVPMRITYLGVGAQFRPSCPPLKGLPDRYLLFVGGRRGYKDFDVLLQAFAAIEDDGTVLLVVGGGPFTDGEQQLLRDLHLTGRVHRVDATDGRLPSIYSAALAFIFPSRYEGFGLPTLEAMACGVPVVLSRSSSHPEVGGDVARYFPPGDVAALALVLSELLGDRQLRADLGRRGLARAAEFSWDRTAEATAEAYHWVRAGT